MQNPSSVSSNLTEGTTLVSVAVFMTGRAARFLYHHPAVVTAWLYPHTLAAGCRK